jgi:hypothetical protein
VQSRAIVAHVSLLRKPRKKQGLIHARGVSTRTDDLWARETPSPQDNDRRDILI